MQPADYSDPTEAQVALQTLVEKHEKMAAAKVLSQQPNWLIEQIADSRVNWEDAPDEARFERRINDEAYARRKAGLIK